ncbi:MAG: hypothetical protein CMK36_06560 [Porticoccaceae bacterium]|nr:hypothetical protein [Porticoccaceae bacterium]|tara:strand:+ start:10741 stop:12393 length:1653 start_codon:yes stop_codon:yes gene_type:complete
MAGKNVDINFRTRADSKGAREAEKGIKKVGRTAIDTDRALDNVEDSAADLRRELDKIDGLDPKIRTDVDKLAGSLEKTAVSGRQMATAQGKNAKSTKNAGLAALEFSRAVEDAQYGMRGVLNNIPQLVQFMGGGAGLAGAISLAAVGLTQLVEALSRSGKEISNLSMIVEVARDQINELYKIAAKDGTSAMRAQIAAVVSSLDDQSSALARNTNLIQKKRQAELELAKITQDLELQEIARAEGALEISPQEADERRKQLEIAKVQSAADEKILQGKEKVELLNQQRLAAGAEQVKLDERIAKLQEKEAELRNKRNALQSRQETAEEAIAKGEEEIKQQGFFSPTKKAIGEARIEGAELIFGEEQRRQLIEVEQRLSQFEGSIETLKSARKAAEEQQMNLSVAQGEAFQIAALTEQTETQAVALKTKLIEAKASNEVAKEARAELSAGVSALETAAKDTSAMTEADRKRVEIANEQFRKIMDDDTLTAEELGQTSQVLGRLTTTVVGATKENTLMIDRLQSTVDQLTQTIATTKTKNIQLTERVNNQNPRR